MSLKDKTAVEWIAEQLIEGTMRPVEIIAIAKEMEKQQIIDAYTDGQNNPYEYSKDNEVNWYDGKKYYNETFKSE
jgi:hypothetical protein